MKSVSDSDSSSDSDSISGSASDSVSDSESGSDSDSESVSDPDSGSDSDSDSPRDEISHDERIKCIYIYTILLVPRLLLRQPFGQMEAPRIPITLCIYKELCFFIQDPHIPNNVTFLCPWDGDGGAAEKQNKIYYYVFKLHRKCTCPTFSVLQPDRFQNGQVHFWAKTGGR